MTTQARPPILLTMADYYGTLAAVLCLGRLGVPVTVGYLCCGCEFGGVSLRARPSTA